MSMRALVLLSLAVILVACAGEPPKKLLRSDDTLAYRSDEGSVADDLRALIVESGLRASTDLASPAGYGRRDETRISVPAALEQTVNLARGYGYGRLTDQVMVDINRGFQLAAKNAMPVIQNMAGQLDLGDVDTLKTGLDARATAVLCSGENREEFRRQYATVLKAALAESGYFASLKILVDQYNNIPILADIAYPDPEPELRESAINGLCLRMAAEERYLREDPEGRAPPAVKRLLLLPR